MTLLGRAGIPSLVLWGRWRDVVQAFHPLTKGHCPRGVLSVDKPTTDSIHRPGGFGSKLKSTRCHWMSFNTCIYLSNSNPVET